MELVPENIQETDLVWLSGNVRHTNRSSLTSQNTGCKRPSVVINKHLERQTDFSWLLVVPGTKLFSEASRPSKGHLKYFDIS